MSDIIIDKNIFCEFQPTENEKEFLCNICGSLLTMEEGLPEDLPFIPCTTKMAREENKKLLPSLVKRIRNFISSLWKHIISGAKRTSKKERQERLDICSKCEYYDGSVCLQCGCPILREANFISKLDWKDQHCPINKW